MASSIKYQDGFKLGVTPRQLEDARRAAQAALDVFAQPEEIRPGQRLCCRGRVTRAIHIAGQRPQAEWPALQLEINRLAAIADQRYQQWSAADKHYRQLCQETNVEPALSEGEPCTCEGCQIEAENIRNVEQGGKLPPLPQQLWQPFDDFAQARIHQASYANQYSTALGFNRDTGKYELKAPSGQ